MFRKLWYFVIAGVLILIAILFLTGQTLQKGTAAYHSEIDKFFASVEAGDYGAAIDGLYVDNPWMGPKSDEILSLKSQFMGLERLVGKYIGNEKLWEELVADRYAHLRYIIFTERQPLIFEFEFYRPHDIWRTYSFLYNAEADVFMQELAQTRFIYKGLR